MLLAFRILSISLFPHYKNNKKIQYRGEKQAIQKYELGSWLI